MLLLEDVQNLVIFLTTKSRTFTREKFIYKKER